MAAMNGWRLFKRRQFAQYERFDVRLEAGLVLLPRDVALKGCLLNVSQSGCLFRPFQSHLISRTGDLILLAINGAHLPGRVMNTTERGYGLAFDEIVPLEHFFEA